MTLGQVLWGRAILFPRGHLAVSRDIFGCHNFGGGGGELLLVFSGSLDARGATKTLVMYQQPLTTKNYLGPIISCTKVEEGWRSI